MTYGRGGVGVSVLASGKAFTLVQVMHKGAVAARNIVIAGMDRMPQIETVARAACPMPAPISPLRRQLCAN